jgi:hypothetical protein
MASIEGNHAPVNTSNYATRFFNVRFVSEAAGVIVTLTSATSGAQFIDCLIDASGDAVATLGFQATASPYLKLINTRFQGAFSTGYVLFGAGQSMGTEIRDCVMTDSAGYGITLNGSTTASYLNVMDNNLIQCAGCTVDDQVNMFIVTRNKFISAAANGDASLHLHASVRAADKEE